MRGWAVAVLVMLATACSQRGRALHEWTLTAPGGPQNRSVTLPFQPYDMPRRELTYALRTKVALDPTEQGAALTLVIDCFHGDIVASAGGVVLDNVGDSPVGEQHWIIPAALSAGPTLDIELVMHWSNLEAVGIALVPRLAIGVVPGRGPIATFNRTSAIIEIGLIAMFVLLYGAIYVMDRRRQNLAVAIGSLFSVVAPMWQLGLVPSVFGPYAGSAAPLAVGLTNVAILYFLHDTFSLGEPPRWLVRLVLAVVAFNVIAPISFTLTGIGIVATLLTAPPFLWHVVRRTLWYPRGDRRRSDAMLLLVALILSGCIMVPDVLGLFLGRSLIGGVHTISLGVIGFVDVMALLLARQHVARQRALETTAEELRRQVAQRSRELSEALGRLAQRPLDLTAERTVDGRYRIVKKLGAGGMGAVYEAVRISDGERVALKTLRGRIDHELMARFAREAQIAAEISHRNLLPVVDVGIADGGLFLVMPLVESGSLEHARSRFGDMEWARPLLRQIADGLATLHARGIVHRDLKPANILLSDGVARIADFGLAAFAVDALGDTQVSDSQPSGSAADPAFAATAAPASPLTRRGAVFGTPAYMAPELATGAHDAQPSSDIFAFGLIAYELLTGKPAFTEPPIVTRGAGRAITTPPALATLPPLVARCLDPDPAKRPSAAELGALE